MSSFSTVELPISCTAKNSFKGPDYQNSNCSCIQTLSIQYTVALRFCGNVAVCTWHMKHYIKMKIDSLILSTMSFHLQVSIHQSQTLSSLDSLLIISTIKHSTRLSGGKLKPQFCESLMIHRIVLYVMNVCSWMKITGRWDVLSTWYKKPQSLFFDQETLQNYWQTLPPLINSKCCNASFALFPSWSMLQSCSGFATKEGKPNSV